MRLFILPLLLAIATLSPRHRLHHPRERDARPRRGGGSPARRALPRPGGRGPVDESPRASGLPDRMAAAVGAGLAQPNKNDYQVKREPEVFTASVLWLPSFQSINNPAISRKTLVGLSTSSAPFGTPYALYDTYFYTVQPKNPKHWRELAGIRVELAIPDTPRLPPAQAAERFAPDPRDQFAFYRVPTLSTADIPADVSLTVGGASAGFHSSPRRWTTWRPTRQESVWVMNWDAPDFPMTSPSPRTAPC